MRSLFDNGIVAFVLFAALTFASTALPSGMPAPTPIGHIESLDPRFDALVPPGAVLERVSTGYAWAEGPLWDARDGSLLFSDVRRNSVLRWNERTGTSLVLRASGYTGKKPFAGREPGSNGLAFDKQGRLVMCQHGERRVARLERDGKTVTPLVGHYRGKRLNSPNDLVVAADGSIYFTDPPFGLPRTFEDPARELPFSGVYRLSPLGGLTLITRDLDAPNGIALSPDGKQLYVSNASASRPIWMVYPVADDGSVGAGREFAEARAWVRDGDGLPDGLRVDHEGNVFAAGPGGIHVFAPDGTRIGLIETGVPTANVAWGEDGSVLYVAANHWLARIRTATQGSLPEIASR
jgi:gluconolactonase